MQVWDHLWNNVHLATMDTDAGDIRDAAIAVHAGKIAWLGKESDLPKGWQASQVTDGQGHWITPGLTDCHTHLVYGGNRSHEFEARLNGVSYEAIAQQGGGIRFTVSATREASEEALLAEAIPRLRSLLKEGVTTVEIKSGYGLDIASERKILRVARRLGEIFPVRVVTTFLGAHALPLEYHGRADAYIRHVCDEMLPALAEEGLVDAVDAFCENIGFSYAQTEQVFIAAQKLGLPVKLHAEQLSDQDGAALTARYQGLSADHLEYLSQKGIVAMAASGTVAVLLPGAFYYLRETKLPPVQALRDAGVPMALATDCNPGTSPMTSLLLTMNMGCTLFRMTPLECLQGVTVHAARALGLRQTTGMLRVGMDADMARWAITRPADLSYYIGGNFLSERIFQGKSATVS
ncbi:imidazolonepropionase [Undibacterium squillarum]